MVSAKLLLEENGKQNDPRNQVIQDLVDEIKPIIDRGQNIILAGDFNEKIWSKEKLSDKLDSIGLFNVFENRMETKSLPRTFSRGTEAIDHIWTTKFILDNISTLTIEDYSLISQTASFLIKTK